MFPLPRSALALPCLLLAAQIGAAHSGGLAADGCHRDRIQGTRHCHQTALQDPQTGRYNRRNWQHWIDADGDGLNTRHEVLAEESLEPVTIDDSKVIRGKWRCPYTGELITDPRLLDIDHLVPLKEAHSSGGADWSAQKKRAYANDLSESAALVAVSRSANRRKGAKDPLGWMPAVNSCDYLADWLKVKRKWQLSLDSAERQAIQRLLQKNNCTDTRLATSP